MRNHANSNKTKKLNKILRKPSKFSNKKRKTLKNNIGGGFSWKPFGRVPQVVKQVVKQPNKEISYPLHILQDINNTKTMNTTLTSFLKGNLAYKPNNEDLYVDFKIMMSNLLNEIFHNQVVSDTPFKNIMRLVSVAINSYYVNYLPNHRVAKNEIEIYESHKFGVVRSKNCIEYGLENDDVLKLETGLLEKIYKGNNFEGVIETKYYENSHQQFYINRDNESIQTKIKIPHVTPLSFKKTEEKEMLDLLQKKKISIIIIKTPFTQAILIGIIRYIF